MPECFLLGRIFSSSLKKKQNKQPKTTAKKTPQVLVSPIALNIEPD